MPLKTHKLQLGDRNTAKTSGSVVAMQSTLSFDLGVPTSGAHKGARLCDSALSSDRFHFPWKLFCEHRRKSQVYLSADLSFLPWLFQVAVRLGSAQETCPKRTHLAESGRPRFQCLDTGSLVVTVSWKSRTLQFSSPFCIFFFFLKNRDLLCKTQQNTHIHTRTHMHARPL